LVFQVSLPDEFYNLLFEISNEYRHRILLLLQEEALRITDIAKEMDLNNPETRRHISRLRDAGLIRRDIEGFYHLTPFGELVLRQLKEIEFTSRHREYFESHSLADVPSSFISKISNLGGSMFTDDIMSFLYNIETVIKEAEEYVWFNVDQYPVTTLPSIVKALERGVEFRTIEHEEKITGPHLILQAPDEAQTLTRLRTTPLIEQKTSAKVDIILYLSEKRCVLAFPDIDGEFDYRGFTATDEQALEWCRDLFLHYWNAAEPKVYISPAEYVRPKRIKLPSEETRRSIVVEGRNESRVDAQAVQDAVDYYDEVILRGAFNFGSSMVQISKSVAIRGEGRENDIPTATIYKQGWRFPFTEFDSIFKIDGEGANVTIENIHFTDFNHTCMWGVQCNGLHIKNNRITLNTGYGRGQSFGAFGDVIIGILVWGPQLDYAAPDIFRGRVTIEGNYIDFARGGAFGGFLTRGGLEDDPEYRPDLFNHEYYMGFGIAVHRSSRAVSIENNVIRNANARGIATTCNLPSADVRIRNNTIISDVYGSYPFSSPEAGAGILAQSAWGFPSPGFNVDIERNTIKLDKLNHSGIIVLGPVTDREGAGKLSGGTIRKNRVHLKNGYEGIHVRKCDDFTVANNVISGEAYYGIRISGRSRSKQSDLRALNNTVKANDMKDLRIRDPDKYSNNHENGRMFATSPEGSATAHIWLNANTNGNTVKVSSDETVIDQGEDNKVQHEQAG
jgi:parallel beta-helix repeat protein